MSDWQRRAQLQARRSQDLTGNNIANGGIFQGLIQTAGSVNQNAKLIYAGGERSIPLAMPFDSTNSWIRSIPETGTPALLAYRTDSREVTFLRYLNDTPDQKLALYDIGKSLYRILEPGEHEIHSSGLAQSYYSQRPVLEQRAGAIRSWLSQDKAEAGVKAPIHTRQLHQHLSDTISDEERFGVVRRPLKKTFGLSPNFFDYPYPDFSLPGGVPAAFSVTSRVIAEASEVAAALTGTFKVRPFAKEYLRVLKNPLSPLPPGNLVDIREGQVFDDEGVQVKGQNGAYLRLKHEFFTPLSDSTKVEIDELGNVNWDLSLGATTGWTTSVPFGNYKLTTGLDIELSSTTNVRSTSLLSTTIEASTTLDLNSKLGTSLDTGLAYSHKVGTNHSMEAQLNSKMKAGINMEHEAGALFNATAGTQMNLKAPLVTVGQSPSEPMVMGTQLTTFLQTFLQTFISNASFWSMGNLGAPAPANPAMVAAFTQLLAQLPTLTSKTITLSS